MIFSKKKIYFGHPVNFYEGSEFNTHGNKESELIKIISRRFPEYKIENPNQPPHQRNYVKWKEEKGNGMKYYFEKVLPKMNAGIFLCFEDGMFGKGVFGEAENLWKRKKDIWEINPEGRIRRMFPKPSLCLSYEETRKRVYGK